MARSVPQVPDDPERLERALADRPARELAALLVRLAAEVPEAGRRVRDLLAQGTPAAAVRRARARLRTALNRPRNFNRAAASTLGTELEEVLDLIAEGVLPRDGKAAFALLRDFIRSDGDALERADDSSGAVSSPFRRACGLLAQAARHVDGAEARMTWEELMDGNRYGCRDPLAELAAQALPAAELDGLIAAWRRRMQAGGERVGLVALELRGLARGRRDPELYAEAALRGMRPEEQPVVALGVVREFLAAGRAAEGLSYLPNSAAALGFYAADWHCLRIELARALGDVAGERAALWESFRAQPAPESFRALLAAEPAASRPELRQTALNLVRSDGGDILGGLELLVAAGELSEAAQLAVRRSAELPGGLYFALLPLAKVLQVDHPLAATALYRALLESILRRAQPKSYVHGASYWQVLERLAGRISEWPPLVPHADYAAGLRLAHARKAAFWREVGVQSAGARVDPVRSEQPAGPSGDGPGVEGLPA